jgi:large subunit ribosomal protein L10
MPRPEKVQAVAEIRERIEGAQAVFLAEYAGLSVAQQQTLRRGLKEQDAEFKVLKMTLTRRAAAELDIDALDELLLGPTGLAFADGDPVSAAKALRDFASDHEVFVIKGGLLGTEFLSPERVSELAAIEPREVLLAKIAGLFAAPLSNVAALLQGLQQEMVGLVQALIDVREESGEVATAPAGEELAGTEEPGPEAAAGEEEPAPAAPADSDEDEAGGEPAAEATEAEAADAAPAEDEEPAETAEEE